MSVASVRRPESGLVPLRDRVGYLQALRVVLAIVVVSYTAARPSTSGLSATAALAWSAGYLGLTAPSLAVAHLRRETLVVIFGASLLLDGIFLAVVTYGPSGFDSPLQYFVIVHVIAVTLLASFRTGLKLSVWHSLLICVAIEIEHPGGFGALGRGSGEAAAIALICVVWAVTLTTTTFAAVNERELRRRNLDLQDLARLSVELETADSAEEIGTALLRASVDLLAISRAIFLADDDGVLRPLAFIGVDATTTLTGDPASDATIREALAERRTLPLTRLRTADPWLSGVMPVANNLLIFPMHVDTRPVGVLIAEYGQRRSARVERRAMTIVEQFVSHTALALVNVWLVAMIKKQATLDGLTGVANRRTFDTRLREEISRSQRGGTPLSLVIVDIDHFKLLNDNHGHQVGDDALRTVCAALSETARNVDLVARYGGEEFVVLLPATPLSEAAAVAERLRIAVESSLPELAVTASFGVSCVSGELADGAALVRTADEALYRAKRDGRNRVTVASEPRRTQWA